MEGARSAQFQLVTDSSARRENLQSSCHGIGRIPPAGRGRAAQFVPIRFVFSNKITRLDKLLLAFDAFVISKMLGRDVDLGRIVYGDDYHTLNVKVSPLKREAENLTDKIGLLIFSPSPPDLVLNRHCPDCECQARCRQKAIDKDDLSLLGSITEKECAVFNSKEIFTVTQLSFTFRPRRRTKGRQDKRESHHYALKELAIREKNLHIVGSPQFNLEGTPVYLDVEGLPGRNFYYLAGVRTHAGDSIIQHSLWAEDPSDEGRVRRGFLSKLMEIDNPVLIHYGSFESIFRKRMRERHGEPPNGSQAAKALDSSVNLLSVIFSQIYLPTYSNWLKEIAGWLGFRWSDLDSSGVQSIEWRNEWQQSKGGPMKENLIAYNSEDCTALELVAHAVSHACQKSIGSNSEMGFS